MTEVTVRAYGPLNDFLRAHRRSVAWPYAVGGHPSVKDLVEGFGIPHPEIDLILVNGASVPFDYVVQSNDRIAVFPRFEALDIGPLTRVRPRPLDPVRFVLDVHLGKLARRLRLVGLDAVYRREADDGELAELAGREQRVLLTRDQALLKRRAVTHGYYIRETHPHDQFVEVLRRFGPLDPRPFSRCLACNDLLHEVPLSAVRTAIPPRTRQHFQHFTQCGGCGRVYWQGSHWTRLRHAIDGALAEAEGREAYQRRSRRPLSP